MQKIKPQASQGLDVLSNKLIKILFPLILPVITKLIICPTKWPCTKTIKINNG